MRAVARFALFSERAPTGALIAILAVAAVVLLIGVALLACCIARTVNTRRERKPPETP